MEERTQYLHRVSHPVHGEVEVYASDRYFAVTTAAKEWGVRWSTIARDCRVQQLPGERKVAAKEAGGTDGNEKGRRAGGKRDGKADQKRKRHH